MALGTIAEPANARSRRTRAALRQHGRGREQGQDCKCKNGTTDR